MAKKSAPKSSQPESDSQESPAETPVTSGEPTINKADAIRKTLAEGITKAQDGVDHIFRTYGLHVTPSHFSASKSREKEPAPVEATKKRGRPPGSTNAPKAVAKAKATEVASPDEANKSGSEADLIESLETLKPLIASMGADRVKRLVDLLG